MKHVEMPSNQKFGRFFSLIFFIFSGYFYWKSEETLAIASCILGALFLTFSIVAPSLLTLLNKRWFEFGLLLGRLVSPIILGAIFFIVISPVALVTRFFGRDTLRIKKRLIPSYWVAKEPADPDAFKNQF